MPAADRRRDCSLLRVGSEPQQDIPTISELLSVPAADTQAPRLCPLLSVSVQSLRKTSRPFQGLPNVAAQRARR